MSPRIYYFRNNNPVAFDALYGYLEVNNVTRTSGFAAAEWYVLHQFRLRQS